MAWPVIIAAGAAVVGGVMNANTASNNAKSARNSAGWNAYYTQQQAASDNAANNQITMFNMAASMRANQMNIGAAQNLADYNSLLMQSTNAYNQSLYEDELTQIFENEGLDLVYLEKNRKTLLGQTVAAQGSSGTTIGTGTNQDVLNQQSADFALQKMVVEQQYDRQGNAIKNAMAQGTWQTDQAIAKLQYETQLSAYTSTQNTYLQAQSNMMNMMVGNTNRTQNAFNSAQSILQGGSATASAYNSQANQAFAGGIISAAGTAASSYSKSYTGTSSGQYGVQGSNVNIGAGANSWQSGSLLATGGR